MLKLGEFQVPDFTKQEVFGGAPKEKFPSVDIVPVEFFLTRNFWNSTATSLLSVGGTLATHRLELRPGIDSGQFFRTIRSYMAARVEWELKVAVIAWLLSEATWRWKIGSA